MSAVQYDDKKTDSAPTLDRVESVSSINKQELVEGQDGITSLPLQEVERVTFTEAEGNAVRRKLDLVILPLMCMVSSVDERFLLSRRSPTDSNFYLSVASSSSATPSNTSTGRPWDMPRCSRKGLPPLPCFEVL